MKQTQSVAPVAKQPAPEISTFDKALLWFMLIATIVTIIAIIGLVVVGLITPDPVMQFTATMDLMVENGSAPKGFQYELYFQGGYLGTYQADAGLSWIQKDIVWTAQTDHVTCRVEVLTLDGRFRDSADITLYAGQTTYVDMTLHR